MTEGQSNERPRKAPKEDLPHLTSTLMDELRKKNKELRGHLIEEFNQGEFKFMVLKEPWQHEEKDEDNHVRKRESYLIVDSSGLTIITVGEVGEVADRIGGWGRNIDVWADFPEYRKYVAFLDTIHTIRRKRGSTPPQYAGLYQTPNHDLVSVVLEAAIDRAMSNDSSAIQKNSVKTALDKVRKI